MPRSGVNGTYNLPPNTNNQAPNTPISSSMFNAFASDVQQTFNDPTPVAYGGTGASNATGARANIDALGPNETADRAFRRGNILGSVSQSGGVPTGALIESGSNANGRYLRFADGTQICTWIYDAVGLQINTPLGALYRTPDPISMPYPAAFVSKPTGVSFTFERGGGQNTLGAWSTTIGLANLSFAAWSTSNWTGDLGKNLAIEVVGRWF